MWMIMPMLMKTLANPLLDYLRNKSEVNFTINLNEIDSLYNKSEVVVTITY